MYTILRINRAQLHCIFGAIICIYLAQPGYGRTIYVDGDAPGANDGSSWESAYRYLQDALANAQAGDEIRVAQGIYRPDQDTDHPNGTGDRKATFELKNDLTIIGGYAGCDAPNPDVHDIDRYKTILSGDLSRNDIEVDPSQLLNEPTRAENSYNVVTANNINISTMLHGITVTCGNDNRSNDGVYYYVGGGIYSSESNLDFTNCTFKNNSAEIGGGIFNEGSENLILTNCIFINNFALYRGGGIISIKSNPVLDNCVFRGNRADIGGGGMCNLTDVNYKFPLTTIISSVLR